MSPTDLKTLLPFNSSALYRSELTFFIRLRISIMNTESNLNKISLIVSKKMAKNYWNFKYFRPSSGLTMRPTELYYISLDSALNALSNYHEICRVPATSQLGIPLTKCMKNMKWFLRFSDVFTPKYRLKWCTESGIKDWTLSFNDIAAKIYAETDSNRKYTESDQGDNSIKLKNMIRGPFLGIFIGSMIGICVLFSEFCFEFLTSITLNI